MVSGAKRRQLIVTLTSSSSSSQSLPTLPFDLIPEILSRLPVKFLLQFQCVCKSWKSLISDPKFAKKHLSLSTTNSLHCISYSDITLVLKSYSLDSILTNITQTQIPSNRYVYFLGSCNGILCLAVKGVYSVLFRLWNPSIRKFNEFPSVLEGESDKFPWMYGFGYDPISDNYKVVVVFGNLTDDDFSKTEVKVHTLGTDSWKNVSEFPFAIVSAQPSGQYVSGTINWLVFAGIKWFIASFDLGNECFKEVLLPDEFGKVDENTLRLSVFKDCLCMIFGEDVWVMKEYGNIKSWTKLFTISFIRDPYRSSYSYIKAICVFEDEQVLLMCKGDDQRWKYISYDCKNNTSKFIEFENIPKICVETLISPYF